MLLGDVNFYYGLILLYSPLQNNGNIGPKIWLRFAFKTKRGWLRQQRWMVGCKYKTYSTPSCHIMPIGANNPETEKLQYAVEILHSSNFVSVEVEWSTNFCWYNKSQFLNSSHLCIRGREMFSKFKYALSDRQWPFIGCTQVM